MSTEQEGVVESGSEAVDGSTASGIAVGKDQITETLVDPLSGQAQEQLVTKRDEEEKEGCGSLASEGDHGLEKSNGFTDMEKQTESVNGGLDLGIGTQNVGVETKESEKKVPVDSEEVVVVKGEKVLCEKDSDGIEEELVVEKEVEPEIVSSHAANVSDLKGSNVTLDNEDLGDVKGSGVTLDSEDLREDRIPDGIESELVVEKEVEPETVCSHGANLTDVKGSDVTLDSEDLGEDRKPDGSGKQGTIVENLDVDNFVCLEPHESKDESSSDDDIALVTPKVKLSDSDMVWAKVRSHPWWPGQVFDASAASDKAKKHSKKGSVLVTYFGDCSFAWNDASKIKPFRQHFSQMAKQSSLSDFVDAIDFALEEVSRRIEFGLACSCISEEVYQNIKTQNIINPGIREDSSSIQGGDKVSSAKFFEPANLVEYVKRLACSPSYDATDGLQFVSQRANLLAFNRWKGYTDLPEFETLQGSVESAPKISPAEEKSSLLEVKVSVSEPKKTKQVYTKRKKTEDQDDGKDDRVFEYEDATVPKKKKEKTLESEDIVVPKKKEEKEKTLEYEDTVVPKKKEKKEKTFEYDDTTVPKKKKAKKEKTLADFIAEIRLSRSNGNKSHENSAIKPDSEKKRKIVHSELPKSMKKIKANLQTEEDSGSPISPKNDRNHTGDKITPKRARASFGIGASIMKAANQMNSSTPTGLITCSNSTSKKAAKNNGSRKSLQKKPKAKGLPEGDISPSPNETLSSPHSASATKNPSEKPNSISPDHLQSEEVDHVIKETPSTDLVKDSKLDSRDLKDSSKEQVLHEDKKDADAANDAGDITMKDSDLTEEKITASDLKEQPGKENCSDGSDSCCKEDVSAE